ncbi:MAG: hypothetical protein Q9174_003246 [Haloplaca sp. 1 TL-2023]
MPKSSDLLGQQETNPTCSSAVKGSPGKDECDAPKDKQLSELRRDWQDQQRMIVKEISTFIDAAPLAVVSDIRSFSRLQKWVDRNHEETIASTDPLRREFFITMLKSLNGVKPYIIAIVKAMEHQSNAVKDLVNVARETMMHFDAFVEAHVLALKQHPSEPYPDDSVGEPQREGTEMLKLDRLVFDLERWEQWLRKRVPRSEGFMGQMIFKCRAFIDTM